MRNFTLILLTIVTILISCGPTVEDAIKYNDTIIGRNDEITTKFGKLIDSYDKFVPSEMDKAYKDALTTTNDAIDFANKLKPFDEDSSFKNGAIQLFQTYKDVLETEHKRIIELLKLPESDYGKEEVTEFEKLIEAAYKKVNLQREELVSIQEQFAKAHQFEINQEEGEQE
jgi:hypothetical protein